MKGVQDETESVGSDVGGSIPPLQGADLPANADAGMYMSEEFRRTMHAWRGTELPAQSAVSRAEVEELARDTESALQATAEQSAWDVARLTHETGTTFGRVEAAMMDMDSRVESLDDRLLHLQEEQIQQQQRTQDSLHSTAALEQQLHSTEQRLKQQADQHQLTLQEQRKYILNLEQMMRAEVKSHQQANDALQQATGDRTALKEEVQELSQRLGSALDQIQKLKVDLATTRSLLDTQGRDKQAANAEASTSAPVIAKSRIPTRAKGKKAPSRSDTPMADAGSTHALPGKYDDLWKRKLDGGDNDGDSSETDGDDYRWVPIWRTIRERKTGPGDCEGSRGCGTDAPAPAQPPAQIRFDIKPKDPPAYHGKAIEDVEVWSQQVDNYLQLLGGDDDTQVAYVGTLLQGAAQLWFQRENNAGRRPRIWTQLAESLCDRFGNPTKADYAQSQLSSMRQGKNESAHDYSLRFEAVLDKIPVYEESWVRNMFVWGLHSNIAQEVNMKNRGRSIGQWSWRRERMWPLPCPGSRASGILGPRIRGNLPPVNNPSSKGKEGTGKIENKIKIGSLVMLGHQVVKLSMQDSFSRGTSQ